MRPRSPTVAGRRAAGGAGSGGRRPARAGRKASHWPARVPCSNAPASIRRELLAPADTLDSGLVFRSIPAGWPFRGKRISSCGGRSSFPEAWAAGGRSDRWDCVTIVSAMDISTELERGQSVSSPGQDAPAIDPAWLKWVPADEAAAFASIALGRGPAFWDGVFAAADRVDREDPARANLAPLADPRQPAGCRGRGPARGGPLAASPGNDLRLAGRSPRPVPAGTRLDRAPHRR